MVDGGFPSPDNTRETWWRMKLRKKEKVRLVVMRPEGDKGRGREEKR